MSIYSIYKTMTRLAPITIGMLEEWNDGIMGFDKRENSENVVGIIIIGGKII